jgi:hypothetical protein
MYYAIIGLGGFFVGVVVMLVLWSKVEGWPIFFNK